MTTPKATVTREFWIYEGPKGPQLIDEESLAHGAHPPAARYVRAEQQTLASRPAPEQVPTGDFAPKYSVGQTVDVYDVSLDKVVDTLPVTELRFRDGHFIYALLGKPGFYSEGFLKAAAYSRGKAEAEQGESEAAWAVRVLDAWADKNPGKCFKTDQAENDCNTDEPWICGVSPHPMRHAKMARRGEIAPLARIAAARALAAADPTLPQMPAEQSAIVI